jgi:putative protease
MLERKNIEILAPVGSWESLRAAGQSGADAVYFGIEQLNMRARSSINFSMEDLPAIVDFCRASSMRSYLAINTILYNHDLTLMKKIIDNAKTNCVDAIIAMDQAAIHYASGIGVPVHLSTQLNITNTETLLFYAHFADVAVLSRELTLAQVKQISHDIVKQDIRGPSGRHISLETFVHGALCMAVSGKCYLSLHTHNASANRGACKQNCRRQYEVTDDEGNKLLIDNEFIMSPKDLCTIAFLDKVLDAGVSILKIEGRGKSADYVSETVSCYREAVESILEGTYNRVKIDQWMTRLENVYNRGFWEGYYLGRKLGEWTDAPGSKAKKKKTFLGNGIKYFSKINVAEFKLQNDSLRIGENFIISGPTTGIYNGKVENLRVDDKEVSIVHAGSHFSMQVPIKVRNSDKLYKVEDS